jgi:hypothetical protein
MDRWLCGVGLSALFLGIGCSGDDDGIYPTAADASATDSATKSLDASDAGPDVDSDAGVPSSGTDASAIDASAIDASAPDSAIDAPVEASISDAAKAIDAASDVVGD